MVYQVFIHSKKPNKMKVFILICTIVAASGVNDGARQLRQKMFKRHHQGQRQPVLKQPGDEAPFDRLSWILQKHAATHDNMTPILHGRNTDTMYHRYFRKYYFRKLLRQR